jgi:hypothetical protein
MSFQTRLSTVMEKFTWVAGSLFLVGYLIGYFVGSM